MNEKFILEIERNASSHDIGKVDIADIFDALTSKRHYKDAFGFEKFLEIIKKSASNHLDSFLVKVFLNHIVEIKLISQM